MNWRIALNIYALTTTKGMILYMKRLELNKGWKVRWEDLDCSEKSAPLIQQKDDWEMLADLPCDIHMPLIRYKHIKEPLEADNYMHCQWTRQKSWWFMNSKTW